MARVFINSRDITRVSLEPNNLSNFDITGLVTSASATYSSLNLPSTGMSIITGNLQLTQAAQNIDFDDRFNENFNRGIRIKTTYTNPSTSTTYNYPVIGITYITASQYNMQSTLTLQIGCILSLLNFRTPQDLGICIEIGTEVAVPTAIINLIKAAGVYDSLIDEDTFTNLLPAPKLIEPLVIQQGESILEAAAKLAANYGTFFYQRNDGIVVLADWKRLDSKGVLFSKPARELHAYTKSTNSESKIKRLILTYAQQSICNTPNFVTQDNTLNDIRTTEAINRNETNRTITRTTNEFRTFEGVESLIATTEETSTYEPESAASNSAIRIGDAKPNGECYPEDSGRLVSKVTISTTDNTNILSAWAAVKASAIEATGFNVSGSIVSKRTEENWIYVSEDRIERNTVIFRPKGFVVPIIGDRALRRPADPLFADDIDPTELVIEDQIIEVWERTDFACVNWRYTKKRYVNQYAEQPEIVAEQAKDTGVALQTIADESFLLVPTENEIQNNVSAPSPETFPPNSNIGITEGEIIFGTDVGTGEGLGFSSNYGLDVIQRTFLGNFYSFPISEIELMGKQLMDLQNGRKLGLSMADSPFSMDFECWSDFVPLFISKIEEPYRELASIFVADTPTITITPEECVVGWLGVFLGANSNLTNPTDVSFIKTVNQPTTDVNVFTPSSVNIEGSIFVNLNI